MTKARHKPRRCTGHTLRLRWPATAAILVICALLAPLAAQATPGGGYAPPGTTQVTPAGPAAPAGKTPYDRHGMWIWYIDRSDGGSAGRIIARARRAHVGTVYVKAGDGGNYWSQFSSSMVRRLHAGGLDVCAWQFVYGDHPVAEAKIAAAAVKRGADCFVIDAEGAYEGKYAAADRYIRVLRSRIGRSFPVSLAGFPYVDYHPSYPYSVFMGPGGAQYNQPQMYWKAIGTSVRAVYEHTYLYNRVYGAPIYPIGQTYDGVRGRDLILFRRFATSYGSVQPSWWSWQETSPREWAVLGARTGGRIGGYHPLTRQPRLRTGSKGDLVVWAQQHLAGAGMPNLPITGIYGPRTRNAVRSFQGARSLPVDGVIGDGTWRALLRVRPVRVNWAARQRTSRGRRAAARSSAIDRPAAGAPASASLPARAYEIDPGPRP